MTPTPLRRRWFLFVLSVLTLAIIPLAWSVKQRRESQHEHAAATGTMTGSSTHHHSTGFDSASKHQSVARTDDEVDHRDLYAKVIDRLSPSVSDCWDDHKGFIPENSPGPLGIKLLYAATYADSDISNGGFFQFFHNSTGAIAPEAVEGLRLVGLHESAALLLKAMEFFGDNYPRDRLVRRAALEALPGYPDIFRREEWDPFLKLGDQYYESRGGFDGLTRAANEFVKQFE